MFLHVFRTWVLANLIHPVALILFVFIDEGEWTMTKDDAGYIFIFFFISFIISIPSLILVRIFIYLILNFNLSSYEKFILWIIAVLVAIFINFFGFILVADGRFNLDGLYLMVPSVIAALLSILIRIRSFFLLNNTINQLNNGNNLV